MGNLEDVSPSEMFPYSVWRMDPGRVWMCFEGTAARTLCMQGSGYPHRIPGCSLRSLQPKADISVNDLSNTHKIWLSLIFSYLLLFYPTHSSNYFHVPINCSTHISKGPVNWHKWGSEAEAAQAAGRLWIPGLFCLSIWFRSRNEKTKSRFPDLPWLWLLQPFALCKPWDMGNCGWCSVLAIQCSKQQSSWFVFLFVETPTTWISESSSERTLTNAFLRGGHFIFCGHHHIQRQVLSWSLIFIKFSHKRICLLLTTFLLQFDLTLDYSWSQMHCAQFGFMQSVISPHSLSAPKLVIQRNTTHHFKQEQTTSLPLWRLILLWKVTVYRTEHFTQ